MASTPSELAAKIDMVGVALAEIKGMAEEAASAASSAAAATSTLTDAVAVMRADQLEIKAQVQATNGRVKALEIWQARLAGAFSMTGGARTGFWATLGIVAGAVILHYTGLTGHK